MLSLITITETSWPGLIQDRLASVDFQAWDMLSSDIFRNPSDLGACLSNPKIRVLRGPFTPGQMEIVNPEPIVCVENYHL